MSNIIAEIVASTRLISSQIDDLVEHGKKEELDALQQDVAAKRERVKGLGSQYQQESTTEMKKAAETGLQIANVVKELEVLWQGRGFVEAETIRLAQERDRLEDQPMSRHVHHAVLQCIADYSELSSRILADMVDLSACLRELSAGVWQSTHEINALQRLLREATEAFNVIEAVNRELQNALAEVEEQHLSECSSESS
ncbi:unnamed protein product [Peniophora sp. CBMAI 1063]|nr:unnamed protein product [Peniophora sp. CBMAI 1063]